MTDTNSLELIVGELKGSVDGVAQQMRQHMADSKEAQERIYKEVAANAATAEKNFDILHSRINKVVDRQDEIAKTQDEFRIDVSIIKGTTEALEGKKERNRNVIRWGLTIATSVGTIFIGWFVFLKDHIMGVFR